MSNHRDTPKELPTKTKIIDRWGERCPEYYYDCQTCKVWEAYDNLSKEYNGTPVRTTPKESWEYSFDEKCMAGDFGAGIDVFEMRHFISQAITADREALIQRLEKEKYDVVDTLRPNLREMGNAQFNRGVEACISLIKEK